MPLVIRVEVFGITQRKEKQVLKKRGCLFNTICETVSSLLSYKSWAAVWNKKNMEVGERG